MDLTNPIFLNWKKEQKVFNKNLLFLKKKLDKDSIHDLRVAVKKLRAYLDLYIILKKRDDPEAGWEVELLSKTNELFDIIGRQRDIEICMEMINKLEKKEKNPYPKFYLFLQSMLKKTKAWSNQSIHIFRNKELAKVALLFKEDSVINDGDILNQQIEIVVSEVITELPKHFKEPHLLRKKLKLIYYWLSLLIDDKKYRPEQIHDILDDLGDMQDCDVLLIRLKHFRKNYLPKPFKEFLLLKEFEVLIDEKKKSNTKNGISKTRKWIRSLR